MTSARDEARCVADEELAAARFAGWQSSEKRRGAHFHVEQMRVHERRARHTDVTEAAWRRERIEGHAARAIAALLEWGLA